MKARFSFGALLSLVCGSIVGLTMSIPAAASDSEPYLQFQQKWAQAQYQQQGDAQEQALATLANEVRASSAAHPDDLALVQGADGAWVARHKDGSPYQEPLTVGKA